MDALGALSGPVTRKLMERAYLIFDDARFERLASIPVSHLYNLRAGRAYQDKRRHWMARNTSTTKLPGYWKSCALNSPSHDHGIPTIMLWWNPKTAPLCVNIWATPIFRNDLPRKSTHSALILSTPMSISTVPASFLKPSLTQRVKSGKSIVTNT